MISVSEHVLGAVEALFGAGTTAAPMPGAMLLRYLHKLQDPWTNGLHLDAPPDAGELRQALSSWQAFERPGRLRWVVATGGEVADELRDAVADAGLVLARRPILHGSILHDPILHDPVVVPPDVTIATIGGDVRDWAGFEVLARWIDLDEDPAVWRWRATRVRNLVQGSRGRAVLARTTAAPVGAAVLLDPPDHRPGAAPVVVCVVHQAHRGRGLAAALVDAVFQGTGPATVLGDADRRLVASLAPLGLAHVADLVEVGAPRDPAALDARKA